MYKFLVFREGTLLFTGKAFDAWDYFRGTALSDSSFASYFNHFFECILSSHCFSYFDDDDHQITIFCVTEDVFNG